MSIDWDEDLLGAIYDSDIATDAVVTLPGGATVNVRAIDAGEGARIGRAIEVPQLEPAAFLRNSELAAAGVPDPKAVVEGTITLNGATWRVLNVQPRPTPDGEDKGETMLTLYRDPFLEQPTEPATEPSTDAPTEAPTEEPTETAGIAFTITAGQQTIQQGYMRGVFGSADGPPDEFFGLWVNNGVDFFCSFDPEEHLPALLEGLILWIDGIPYPGIWAMGEGLNYELGNPAVFPVIEAPNEYLVEFKAPPAGLWFTMVAGMAEGLVGYSTGNFGEISHEPIEGETLQGCAHDGTGDGGVSFNGNLVAELAGKTVYVNAAPVIALYGEDFAVLESWTILGADNGVQLFEAGGRYLVEIRNRALYWTVLTPVFFTNRTGWDQFFLSDGSISREPVPEGTLSSLMTFEDGGPLSMSWGTTLSQLDGLNVYVGGVETFGQWFINGGTTYDAGSIPPAAQFVHEVPVMVEIRPPDDGDPLA